MVGAIESGIFIAGGELLHSAECVVVVRVTDVMFITLITLEN